MSKMLQVAAFVAPLRRAPAPTAPLDTEALAGERVAVLDEMEGWVWGRLEADGYEGYLPLASLAPVVENTHRVTVPRTFVYPGPSIKLPPVGALPLGGLVRIELAAEDEQPGEFVRLSADTVIDGFAVGGYVFAAHLLPIAQRVGDPVSAAETLLHAPYLWGGKTALGVDCSGLVQLSFAACGVALPRDSGPQQAAAGVPVAEENGWQRGDLVFWPGHVGILRDAQTVLHASGHHMQVVSEPLEQASKRIAERTGAPISLVRRVSLLTN